MVFQANRYYGAPQKAHNEHAILTNEKRDQEVARHGDIKQAPSGLTQFWRGVKNAPSGPLNMLKNLVSTAAVIAPIPSFGKIKAIGNIGKTIASKAKEIKMFGINKDLFRSTQSISNKLAKPLSSSQLKKVSYSKGQQAAYSQQYDDAVNLLQSNPAKASKFGLNPLSTSIKRESMGDGFGGRITRFVPTNPRAPTGVVGKPGIPAYSKKDPLWPKSVDEKLYPSNWPAWHK